MNVCRLNQKVQHRAWKFTGRVIDFPFNYNPISYVTIVRDDTGQEQEAWIPAIMAILDEEEEIEW